MRRLNFKVIPFQTIQFRMSTQISSIRPIDSTLLGAINLDQSGPGSDDKDVLNIPQCSSITATSPSDCLVSYTEHSLQALTTLQIYSRGILKPQWTGQYTRLHIGLILIYIYIYIYIYMCVCVCACVCACACVCVCVCVCDNRTSNRIH